LFRKLAASYLYSLKNCSSLKNGSLFASIVLFFKLPLTYYESPRIMYWYISNIVSKGSFYSLVGSSILAYV